jgi:hypothetical protein
MIEIELYFQVFYAFRFARKFSKTAEVTFDVDEEHKLIIAQICVQK